MINDVIKLNNEAIKHHKSVIDILYAQDAELQAQNTIIVTKILSLSQERRVLEHELKLLEKTLSILEDE